MLKWANLSYSVIRKIFNRLFFETIEPEPTFRLFEGLSESGPMSGWYLTNPALLYSYLYWQCGSAPMDEARDVSKQTKFLSLGETSDVGKQTIGFFRVFMFLDVHCVFRGLPQVNLLK